MSLIYGFNDEQEALSVTNFLSIYIDGYNLEDFDLLVACKFFDYNIGSGSYLFKVKNQEQYYIVIRETVEDYEYKASCSGYFGFGNKSTMLGSLNDYEYLLVGSNHDDVLDVITNTN